MIRKFERFSCQGSLKQIKMNEKSTKSLCHIYKYMPHPQKQKTKHTHKTILAFLKHIFGGMKTDSSLIPIVML